MEELENLKAEGWIEYQPTFTGYGAKYSTTCVYLYKAQDKIIRFNAIDLPIKRESFPTTLPFK